MSKILFKKYKLKNPKKSILGIKTNEWWFASEYGKNKSLRNANSQDVINATGIYKGECCSRFLADKEGNLIPRECVIL